MYLLLDTSGEKTVLALIEQKKVLAFKKKALRNTQSKLLLREIEELLLEVGAEKRDLEGILLILGPGSYTGLRIGIATANALAFALDIPIGGVTKFEIAARNFEDQNILFAVPSFRNHFLVAKKLSKGDRFFYQMLSFEDLIKVKDQIVLIGKTEFEGRIEGKIIFFDYQTKRNLIDSFDLLVKNLKKGLLLTPFYFQEPKITKKRN